MKKLSTCIFLFFLTGYALYSHAQSGQSTLSGKIVDETGIAAEAVTVALLTVKDSALVKAASTTKSGLFSFSGLGAGRYLLLISRISNRKTYFGPYTVLSSTKTSIPDIRLEPDITSLATVTITGVKKLVEVRRDKIILNVERNPYAQGASFTDLLRTAPGVKVSGDGQIAMHAGQQPSVMINGKLLQLSGADLTEYLRSLPSSGIEQIELIPNPPAKYDAAGNGGLINIILKKGKNTGLNNILTTSAGYGNFGKAGINLNTNYRTGKINIFGNAGYRYDKTDHTINTDRNVHGTALSNFSTRYYNTQRTPRFDYRIGTDYSIDSDHTVGFLVYGNTGTSRFNKRTTTLMQVNGQPDSMLYTTSYPERSVSNVNYNLNYSGKIGHTKQTLSADADYSVYRRTTDEILYSKATRLRPINQPTLAIIQPAFSNDTLRNYAPTRYDNKSFKIDYVNPVSASARLEAGVKVSDVKSDNQQEFDVVRKGIYKPYAPFTSTFMYAEKIAAAYVNYAKTSGRFNYTAGLRAERRATEAESSSMGLDVDRKYISYYPSLLVNYNLKNQSSLTLDFSRRIDPPAYENLNPIVYFQDNYNFRSGNAFLKPAYKNELALKYSNSKDWLITLNASRITDFWSFTYFIQDDKTKTFKTTKVNFKAEDVLGLTYSIPFKLTSWWRASVYGEATLMRFTDTTGYSKNAHDLNVLLQQNFNIAKNLTASIDGYYDIPTYFGILNYKKVYYSNASVIKQFASRKITLTFAVTDIFNTRRDRTYSNYKNLDFNLYDKPETRVFRLSVSYRFGKSGVKASRRRNVGNDEEQKRMSGSN
ncbi:TonB-dependent receptor [Mucilaginibacter sp. RS28]|uniref:TonB-dependent receptor n=1 Tax=Mucilaginibacter straminoryzae TaxID=2932774 RepID=A0A9X1X3D3_9SPHI|nr:TonB-dependent receptor [Mucilaginibacter straminoryzae]MCJ8209350.1 TonB-dependent receptor [Mucilaginibacter straminoryzae]